MFVNQYDKFAITGITDSRSEKMQIMPTTGDTYIATFTGREPHILGVNGNLIFDYDRTKLSWYSAFMDAYEYYLRASRSSKWRCKVRLVLPSMQEFVGYIININSTIAAESDIVVPFAFSMLVVDKTPARPIFSEFDTNSKSNGTLTKTVDKSIATSANPSSTAAPTVSADLTAAQQTQLAALQSQQTAGNAATAAGNTVQADGSITAPDGTEVSPAGTALSTADTGTLATLTATQQAHTDSITKLAAYNQSVATYNAAHPTTTTKTGGDTASLTKQYNALMAKSVTGTLSSDDQATMVSLANQINSNNTSASGSSGKTLTIAQKKGKNKANQAASATVPNSAAVSVAKSSYSTVASEVAATQAATSYANFNLPSDTGAFVAQQQIADLNS